MLNEPYTGRVLKHYMSFENKSIVLLKSFFKVGHWEASTKDDNNNDNKPVQLNNHDAIDWTGQFWQELQCLVKKKNVKAQPLEGRKITVVTIEVGRNNLETKNGTMTFSLFFFALPQFRSQEILNTM